MRILVTGASGFLGRHLIDRLRADSHSVWAIVHDTELPDIWQTDRMLGFRGGVKQIRGSVSDLVTCERAMVESRADVVFHLAAQAIVPHSRQDPYGTFESNIRGTYSLLEAFRRHRTPEAVAVVASSDKAYGECPVEQYLVGPSGQECEVYQPRPYVESDALEGRGPYDASKSCTDLLAQSYVHEFGLPIGIIRAGNIYGPGDVDMTRIVPSIASALARRESPVLTSDGFPVRDYLYVNDAVDGYLCLMQRLVSQGPEGGRSNIFNLSGGRPISAMGLAELAVMVSGEKGLMPQAVGTRKGEIQHQVLNSNLARRLLSWKPVVSLEQGLKETITWWRFKHMGGRG